MSDNHDVVVDVNVTDATEVDVVDVDDEDAEFGGFEMAEDAPTAAEAQPLPATWLILAGPQQSNVTEQKLILQDAISSGTDNTHSQIISEVSNATTTTTMDSMSNSLTTSAVNEQQQHHDRETPPTNNGVFNQSPPDGAASIETSSFPPATVAAVSVAPVSVSVVPAPVSVVPAPVSVAPAPVSVAPVSAPMLSPDDVTLEMYRQQLHCEAMKYSQLQEQHKVELLEMRRVTQETLSVIVQQHQELCSAAIQDCELACKRQMLEFVDHEKKILADTMQAQEEKIAQMLEDERVKFSAHLDDCLQQQRLQQQETFETFLQEERERFQAELNAAAQEQQVSCQKAVEEAVQAERQLTQQVLLEQQEISRQTLAEESELARKTLQDACQLERIQFKQATDAVVNEQKSRIESIMADTLKLARQQITLYVSEQRQDDYSVRLRLTSSIDVLLETARQQLQQLLVAPPSEPRQQQQQQQLAVPSSDQRSQLITDNNLATAS